MPAYAVDLHNHTPMTDDYRGAVDTSGGDIVRAVMGAGIQVFAVTDHFCLGFFGQVRDAAAQAGAPLLVLPGIEVRLSWHSDEVHVIALFPPDDAEARVAGLMEVLGFRRGDAGQRLQHVVLEHDPVAAAVAVDALGGMSFVAHVDRPFGAYRLLGRPLLRRLVGESPIVAVEFVNPGNAVELGMLRERVACIQNSDSHHVEEIGRRRTIVEAEELSFDALRRALGHGFARTPAGAQGAS